MWYLTALWKGKFLKGMWEKVGSDDKEGQGFEKVFGKIFVKVKLMCLFIFM